MAVAREKLKVHRKRKLEKTSIKLLQPITPEAQKVKEKIKIATKTRSALVAGEGAHPALPTSQLERRVPQRSLSRREKVGVRALKLRETIQAETR